MSGDLRDDKKKWWIPIIFHFFDNLMSWVIWQIIHPSYLTWIPPIFRFWISRFAKVHPITGDPSNCHHPGGHWLHLLESYPHLHANQTLADPPPAFWFKNTSQDSQDNLEAKFKKTWEVLVFWRVALHGMFSRREWQIALQHFYDPTSQVKGSSGHESKVKPCETDTQCINITFIFRSSHSWSIQLNHKHTTRFK